MPDNQQMVASIGLAAVKHVKDGHHASGVINIVQNAPVAHPHAPGTRSTVAKQETARRARVLSERVYRCCNAWGNVAAKIAKLSPCDRQDDEAHRGSLPAARSSAFTCSQGIGSPPSARASSAARMSARSSSDSSSLSYSLMGRTTAVRLPFSSTRNCLLVRLCTGLSFVSMVLAVYLGPARWARRIRKWQRAS